MQKMVPSLYLVAQGRLLLEVSENDNFPSYQDESSAVVAILFIYSITTIAFGTLLKRN